MGKTNEDKADLVHMAKGNRGHTKDWKDIFRPLCDPCNAIIETMAVGCTYSLTEITCAGCLEALIAIKEKELKTAKEYLKYCKRG